MPVRIPRGIICNWTGSAANIPLGWGLCDGSLGTPDMRNRFVIGAGDTYTPRDTGGSATHDHDFTGDGHSHTMGLGIGLNYGTDISTSSSTESAVGTTDPASSLPPYYALCYIMRL